MTTLARRWRGLDLQTIEHCQIIRRESDTRIRGTIVGPDFGLFYRIKLNEIGNVRDLKLDRTDGRSLELYSDGAGNWSDDRAEPLSALSGCIDIDIWPTPLTNSLPIWRTQWVDGQSQRFLMTWIDATQMQIKRAEQIYTRLDATHFRYQSADFERVLEIDADGLVVNYPGLFDTIP